MVVEGEPMDTTTSLPTGTVTFLFTDIEGSTQLWEQHPAAMRLALARHDALVRAAIETNNGHIFKMIGDAFCAAFANAADALDAALATQQNLRQLQPSATTSIAGLPLQVRVALHTGAAELRQADYFGPALNRVARLLAIGHGGQVLLSGATQELVQDDLPPEAALRDLGAHRLRDLQRPEQVFQLLHPELPSDFPPLKSLDTRPNNLPVQRSSILGREKELAAARDLLRREEVGLVTLTGPGGTGKTRLGLQVASDLLDDFPDGVFFVDLAPIRDPDLVASTIARALRVQETGGQLLLEAVKAHLREKQLLLLLDNFEQVMAAAPKVAELLSSCRGLKLLVTSREGLRLRGEQEFKVPPLTVPDPKRLPPVEALCEYAAVALFLQRAASARLDFTMTDENAPAVAEICHRLDGLPLAIELAAARIKLFAPEGLLPRLGSRLKVLTGGARDLPARHQTLRDAITWSYDLLDEDEKRLFRRLSVFVGGCTPEAAEVLANAAGNPPIDVLDRLASLADKSLVRQESQADGEPRFWMLETIREFAFEQLAASGEAIALQRQHVMFFLALAEQAEAELARVDQPQRRWFDRLEAEAGNLRAALNWTIENGEAEAGLRLAGALGEFWDTRGHWKEGREHLARLLALNGGHLTQSGSGSGAIRAKALHVAGTLAYDQRDYGAARALFEESGAIWRELGEKRSLALSLHGLAHVVRSQGDRPAARVLYEESLALRQEVGDQRGIASSLVNIGATCPIDQNEARRLLTLGLEICRDLGYRRGMSYALHGLASLTYAQGDYATARTLLEESLTIRRELDEKAYVAGALNELGLMALGHGDTATARTCLEESLTIVRALGDRRRVAWLQLLVAAVNLCDGDTQAAHSLAYESLAAARKLDYMIGIVHACEVLAGVAVAKGRAKEAARLMGSAERVREAHGAGVPSFLRVHRDRAVADARAALGEEVFAAAWEAGRAMSLEDAVAYALQDDSEA
jgi:predicted ATPase/class 3 adenylate cyclase